MIPSTEKFELMVALLSQLLSKSAISAAPGGELAAVTPAEQLVGLVVDQLLATEVLAPLAPTQYSVAASASRDTRSVETTSATSKNRQTALIVTEQLAKLSRECFSDFFSKKFSS